MWVSVSLCESPWCLEAVLLTTWKEEQLQQVSTERENECPLLVVVDQYLWKSLLSSFERKEKKKAEISGLTLNTSWQLLRAASVMSALSHFDVSSARYGAAEVSVQYVGTDLLCRHCLDACHRVSPRSAVLQSWLICSVLRSSTGWHWSPASAGAGVHCSGVNPAGSVHVLHAEFLYWIASPFSVFLQSRNEWQNKEGLCRHSWTWILTLV